MSKLADAMRRATRREVRPIGFTTAGVAANPTMLIFARTSASDAAAAAAAGADAIIVSGSSKKAPDAGLLWGTDGAVDGRAGAESLQKAGADFIILDADTTDASVLLEEDLGYVMRIDLNVDDTFLRTVETLPLDALLAPALEGALTVRRTLDLRRVTSFTRRPLLLAVAPDIDGTALEALRDCGVIGVVVDGAAGAKSLRPTIDKLAPRRRKGDGRNTSVALRATGSSYEVEELSPEPDEDDG